ncbi:Low temperature viability protein [Ancylostoma caninum]|uniref:Protein LTV1 homolog n=1 Tax=Ancylostoma caninum TaxID=29170 RepID=A0A368GU62_ANCCA|nr:Low temperature viability protein [Ancylostoma caninum]
MGKKKAFLDKKNAVHFRLVPKSAAESGPEEGKRFVPTQEHLEEQHKYGIFFDDDYDYMQHLRDIRETGTLQTLEEAAEQEERYILRAPKFPPMPSALFGETSVASIAKKEEEEIFDEDVEKALEGNFEGEIEGGLEDDFIALAGGLAEPVSKSQTQHREPAVHINSDEEDDDQSDYDDYNYGDEDEEEEEKATQEVQRDGPRREIDDRFDQLLEADYHDDQLGELDGDDFTMGGTLEPNDERVKRMIKESHAGPVDDEEASKEWTRQRLRLIEAKVIKDDEDMETVEVDESASKRLKWDCESYATQYSNIYNHPTLIQNPKSGKLSRRALKRLDREAQKVDEMEVDDEEMQSNDDDTMSQCTQASTYRPKGETPEQRRLRKQAIKEARRFRRQEKKGNKMAFAEEHRKVAKERAGHIKTVPIV